MGKAHPLVNILLKKGVFTLLFISTCFLVSGQYDLSGSQQHSTYTYIYRVSEREALALFRSGMKDASEKYLHNLVDSFKEAPPLLAPGDYLWVSATGSKLFMELRTIGDLQYDLINNNRDLALSLHTREGMEVAEAKAVINNRLMPYDPATHTYRISRYRKGGTIKVTYQGALYFFPVNRRSPWHSYRPGFRYKLVHSFPLKLLSPLLGRWFPDGSVYHNRFSDRTTYEQRYRSYMVFSKPKYKPGDSVQGKAFITNKRGRPVNRPLWVRISNYHLYTDTLIELLRPYRAGGYSFSFVLTDSLHLTLDDEYLVTLEEFKSRKYNTEDYDGDLDEDEYAARRKVTARGHFKYEDYSLQSIRFIARTDKKENSPGNPVVLYFKATDENDLPLPDASLGLVVRASRQADQFHADKVFIKDTLWTWAQPLDPVGETKVVVPDSIFPAADLAYTIQCRLLNSSNETQTETFYQSYKDEVAKIFFLPGEDSLGIDYRIHNSSHPMPAMLFAFNEKNDTLESRPLMLPGVIRINPYSSRYKVVSVPDKQTGLNYEVPSAPDKRATIHQEIAATPDLLSGPNTVRGEYQVSDQRPGISCIASRTKDSVSIVVVNPFHLKFWYTLFAGDKIRARGYSDQLSYIARTTTPKNYFISLQYIWAAKVAKEDYTVPYRDKLLQVTIHEPSFIYPGQTTTLEIGVRDAEGRPVPHADLTAWSFTSKFKEAPTPAVPYLGKWYRGRKRHPDFYPGETADLSALTLLNWKRWSREMGLDTLEYYKFLHPAGIYVNTEPARDQLTQIAPFVSWRGQLVPIHQLYIDEVPIFFSQAQQLSRYSFFIEPGQHSLQLRTPNRMIRLDSIRVVKGMKTFVSIDADTSNKAVHIQKMPDSLTNEEKARWSRYMILVENNFGEKFAHISQANRIFLLNGHPDPAAYYSHSFLVGPLVGQQSMLRVAGADGWRQDFEPEGNQRFLISKGLIKEKQMTGPTPYPFSAYLEPQMPRTDFHDWILTEKDVDSLWQDYLDDRGAHWDLFRNETLPSYPSGTLQVGIEKKKGEAELFIKNLFLFRYDNPDFMQVYKGTDRKLGTLQPGNYRLLALLKGDRYLMRDSIQVLEGGLNYYEISSSARHEKDTVSTRIAGIVNSLTKEWKPYSNGPELDGVRESFNDKYLNPATFPRMVMGKVTDMNGRPLMAVSITLKGTHIGTSTDAEGYFRLHTPEKGTLVINYIGYSQVERSIGDTAQYEIRLHAVSMALNEVVVVGYGVSKKKSLTGSISAFSSSDNTLIGKVAGIQIRGISSVAPLAPLVIVDGLPYEGDYRELDPAGIASIRVLKEQEATAIYGQNAAGGVILISTKKKTAEDNPSVATPVAGNKLRRHFRDDAFWQPMLSTDEKGLARFSISYPDDITSWKTRVVAVNGRYTGFAEGTVKSFKALSADLACPSFLVKGDSVNLIGKMLNYTPDTLIVQRSWFVDDRELMNSEVALTNSRVEVFPVQAESLPDPAKKLSDSMEAGTAAGSEDSLKVKYTLLKKDGYFDGEERVIPVFKRGVRETQGVFSPLEEDSSFALSFDPAQGPVQIYAESSILPVLLEEIESIGDYKYLCNEQLASKLRALLEKKKIYLFLGKAFQEDKNIRTLISKLVLARGTGGLWGWWSHNEPALWISLHVSEALLEAEKAGFSTNLNRPLLRDYLVYNLESCSRIDKIHSIRLLQQLDAKADYKRYIDSAETQILHWERAGSRPHPIPLYEKLKLQEVKQEAGMEIRLDTLIAKHQVTVMGNWYWGEENRSFFDNALQNTLLMYRLLRKAGGHTDMLRKVRNYFLEKRKEGHWRNTYESSLILETILPDLLEKESHEQRVGNARMSMPGSADTLRINGESAITAFPYKTILPAGGRISFNKKGKLPVYFTAYQQFWNEAPKKVSGEFDLSSSFEKGGQPLPFPRLKGGEPVVLKTRVSVKADAEYVMIEIPIPAGCSYREKEQPYYSNEVHREYFKNKVSIFCRSLSKGEYVFDVTLLPRYTGRFFLNPARAELMYFPVFYGREGMKEVNIY